MNKMYDRHEQRQNQNYKRDLKHTRSCEYLTFNKFILIKLQRGNFSPLKIRFAQISAC